MSRINLLQSTVNVFHLTWIVSPHYLRKFKVVFCENSYATVSHWCFLHRYYYLLRSHAGMVVPECFKDNGSQWKSRNFDPHSLRKPCTDRILNLHGWLCRGPLLLSKISSRYDYPLSPPQICENAHQVTRLVFFCFFVDSAYSQESCIDFHDQYAKYNVVSLKDVPFGGPENNTLHFNPVFSKRKFSANFWRDVENFGSKRP